MDSAGCVHIARQIYLYMAVTIIEKEVMDLRMEGDRGGAKGRRRGCFV